MGCLGVFIGLAAPRVVMVVLWIFTNYLSRAYNGFLIPLLGFFLLPTTTLAYAVAKHETHGLKRWGLMIVVIAVVIDLGIWGNGRDVFSRE